MLTERDKLLQYKHTSLYNLCCHYIERQYPEMMEQGEIIDEGLSTDLRYIIEEHLYGFSIESLPSVYQQIDNAIAKIKRSISMCSWF
ncbi:hypothetical protein V6R21_18835 [Limibacter armeniacum]|uniref:hypothetical protein n=1 Tax=Limibacter armeniacum TaxID=466084 RepID=UPI002FE5D50D